MSRSLLSLLATLPLLAASATAQTSTIIDRAGQPAPVTPAAPASAAGNASPAPGAGSDEGVLRVAEPRRLPLRLSANFEQQLHGTDNVFLAPSGTAQAEENAIVAVSTLALRADTLPAVLGRGQLVSGFGYTYQRHVHGLDDDDAAVTDLDFESHSLPLSAAYRWGRGWEAGVGVTYGQLYSVRGAPTHEKLYSALTVSGSLRKLTELGEGRLLSLGATVAGSETWTRTGDVLPVLRYRDDRNDKVDLGFDTAVYLLGESWVVVPYASLTGTHYAHYQEAGFTDVDRDDLTLTVGLSAAWNFAPWGALRAFTGYDRRFSSEHGGANDYTYDAGTLGLGLSLSARY